MDGPAARRTARSDQRGTWALSRPFDTFRREAPGPDGSEDARNLGYAVRSELHLSSVLHLLYTPSFWAGIGIGLLIAALVAVFFDHS